MHGLKGDIKIQPWCNSPEDIISIKNFYLNNGESLILKEKRLHKNIVLAKIENENALEKLKNYINKIIYIKREDIKLKHGEYLIVDLIGVNVIDNNDENVNYGTIFDVIKTGSNDVYCVRNENGKEHLIPAIKNVVNDIDIDLNIMRITPMKWLFENEN